MKRAVITFIVLTLILMAMVAVFAGCEQMPTVKEGAKKGGGDSLFTIIEYNDSMGYMIVYMNDTKVMYAVSTGMDNHGDFLVLVNADGSPMVYEGKE